MTEPWIESALERLRATSGRSGTARREVVEFLGRQDCCFSAQEIHDRLRERGARVGIASVYRTLEGLDRSGLVQRIDLGDGVSRFEPAVSGDEHHHHFVCDDCGKVEPFADAALEATLARIAGGHGYALETHDVVLRGGCGTCRPAA
jgi:Fur family transcriptional regulator, ferric uptake regulator